MKRERLRIHGAQPRKGTNTPQRLRWGALALLAGCLLAAGCGAKGDLYLPGQQQQQGQH